MKYEYITFQEEKSLMTFEDQQIFGRVKIMEKIQVCFIQN